MGFHTYPIERADALDDPSRYRYCSREELVAAVDPGPDETIADLGSGTGFYTDDVAPFAGRVYAVDVQAAMHDRYRERGLPESVEPVTAEVADLPFAAGELDAAFSTMTYHEYATADSLAELARAIRPGGRLVTVDWRADAPGEDGPPVDERFSPAEARDHHTRAGFSIDRLEPRPETFLLVATR